MAHPNRPHPRHTHFSLSADIADIVSPDAAPRTLRFSETNERIFQAERRASYPGGHSKEQGGTIVADAAGRLQIQNLGGTGSTAGTFSPDLTPKEPAKYTVVGILHTHPYDRTEGSYNGVSFSGGDIAYLINNHHLISVVQSGPRIFAIVRTALTPPQVDFDTVNDDQNAAIQELVRKHRTFQQASRIEVEIVSPKYGLAYYQGSQGVLTRVSPR